MHSSRSRTKSRRSISSSSFLNRALEALESRVLLSGNTYINTVYSFTGGLDGSLPFDTLIADSNGDIFGTAAGGGQNGQGSIFELPLGQVFPVTLQDFTGTNGANPYAGLTMDSFGDLFGVTYAGGADGLGTLFEIPAGAIQPNILYSFTGSDGANPYAAVVLDSAGDIFGTTTAGGAFGDGSVFEYSGGILTTLHSFNGLDGKTPWGGVTLLGSALYGTTFAAGGNGDGTVWKLSDGVFSTIHVFAGTPDDGAGPTDTLVTDGVGDLFGTTSVGGADNDGTIFGVVASTGTLSTLYTFTGGNDGASPFDGLSFDSDGNLYGTTYKGGGFGHGTVFEIPVDSTIPQTLHAFTGGSDGENPYGGVLVSPAGGIFGTTTAGGSNGDGTIFELVPTTTTQLVVAQQPSTAQAGTKSKFVIDLQKSNDSNNGADNSAVSLVIVSGPDGATLGGVSTVQAHSGVATFSNLEFTRAGTYTLAAVDGTLDPATLDTVVVTSGPPAKIAFNMLPTNTTAGQDITAVTVAVEDALGNVIETSSSMITLKLGTGPTGSVLNGTLTMAAVNGVATFDDLELDKAGTYTLSASTTGFSAVKSSSFVITPDMASAQLVITQQPATATVGKKLSPGISLSLQDQFGNAISNSTSQLLATLDVITLGGTATSAQLTGTSLIKLSKGKGTFSNLFISQPGDYQIQISGAGVAPVLTGTIDSVFLPTHLSFTQQPVQTIAGAAEPDVVVSILDAEDHVDTTNDSNVTLTFKGNGTVNGTLTVAAVNGVATFSGLSIDQAGTFTLSAASGSLTVGKSSSFKITPDTSTAHLVITQVPNGSVVVGKALSPTLTVEVADQFGNRITADHSTVTLTAPVAPTDGTPLGKTTLTMSSGVATFKNIVLPVAGSYSMMLTDSTLANPADVLFPETVTQGVTTISGLPKTLAKSFGQTISLTATVKSTAPTSIPFTGVATLEDSLHDVLGTVSLTAAGQAKFSVTDVVPGNYIVDVSYPGDANHTAATSSTFMLNIGLGKTSTVLTASSSTLVVGQSLTLTATVDPSLNIPTGNVVFYEDSVSVGTVSLSGATASLTLSAATLGKHTYKAVYSGDSNFANSTSSGLTRTAAKDKALIALTASTSSPVAVNQTFNLDINVALIMPGASPITGDAVTIKDNGKVLTTLNLDSSGDATLPGLSYTAPGTQSFTIIFAGDANVAGTTSSAVKLTVAT